jgi:PAS domain S-box-containing protein
MCENDAMTAEVATFRPDVEERLRFETMLAELSFRFVNLPACDVDREILDAQRRVCECLGLDLSSLWQWDGEDPGHLILTHLYRSQDGPETPDRMTAEEYFPWCNQKMVAGKTIVGSSLDDFPPEASRDRDTTEHFGIKAFLTVPLSVGGGPPIGALSFNTTHEERSWPDEIQQRLALIAEVFTNALERARSDTILRESEERLQLAAESGDVSMWVLDVERGQFWSNERGRKMFGFPADTDISMELFLDAVHPDDRDRITKTVQKAIAQDGEIDMEYRIVLPGKGIRWVHSRGRMHEAEAGEPKRMQGASVDITERKNSEELVADQLHFETLLTDLSARFVRASGDEVESEVGNSLAKIGGIFGCDRCGLLRVGDDPQRLNVAHAWFGEGIDELPEDVNLAEIYPWMFQKLVHEGKAISIASRHDLPPEADRDRQTMEELGTKSILVVPLEAADGVRWVLVASTMRHEREWHPTLAPRLRLFGEVMLNALERQRADEALKLSYTEVEKLKRQLELENVYLKREHRLKSGSGRIVGESPAILKVLEMAEQVAPTNTSVLVEGETGTGKELIAQRIHELSPRRDRPMVKVNCAALPSTLVESELFGREKGAYTGAVSREPGRFEVANGSTLLLDEISELPLELQAKLLRVLEEGQYERVGSSKTLNTDVRVIAATNRDLQAEVDAGRFRRDLFFRLAVFPIRVPPLRERRQDVPLLVWAAVEEFGAAMHKSIENIGHEDMERMRQHDWPGNVRELRNVVERALILCRDPVLEVAPPVASATNGEPVLSLDEAQRRQIDKALHAASGKISGTGGAAEMLGLKPTTLRSKMARLGLDPKHNRSDRSSP